MGKFITPYGDRKFYKGPGRKSDKNINDSKDNYQDAVVRNLEKTQGIEKPVEQKEEWEMDEKQPELYNPNPLRPKEFTGKIRRVKRDGTVIEYDKV